MKSLTDLWKNLAYDIGKTCDTSVERDIKTVMLRVEKEGDSFLTITLPAFSKDFERSLENEHVDSTSFVGFRRSKGGPLPSFLGGFLSQVFNSVTGSILNEPNVNAIAGIRQLCMVFGKLERECSQPRIDAAFGQYIETDRLVQEWNSSHTDEFDPKRVRFREVAALLFSDVLTIMDRKVYEGELIGKHGPGATADRLVANAKWDVAEWHSRLEVFFPYGEHLLPNWRYYNQLEHVTMREPKEERPVRVVTVPKTLKTPRIIAIEPTCMQYAQQAILAPLIELLESDNFRSEGFGKNLVSGMIGFTDQEPNRLLAREGSRTAALATLDLSEASDRVSSVHVSDLLNSEKWPYIHAASFASRSSRADVPGWGVIPLSKFASMGSALCFPFEAMVFLTVVFVGILGSDRSNDTRQAISAYRDRVRVYGDDIVVPTDCVSSVLEALEAYGYKVNTGKSFWNGKFRESCGGDYYAGEQVTPVRLRRDLPENMKQASNVGSAVSYRNQLYKAGWWNAAASMDQLLSKLLRGNFPTVHESSSLLGRHTRMNLEMDSFKQSRDTQAPIARGFVLHSASPTSVVDGVGALRKCLDPRRQKPFEDPRHLSQAGRPDAVRIKLRWRSPF